MIMTNRTFNPLVVGSNPTAPISTDLQAKHEPEGRATQAQVPHGLPHYTPSGRASSRAADVFTKLLFVAALLLIAALANIASPPTADAATHRVVRYCKAASNSMQERRECVVRRVFAQVGEGERAVRVARCESGVRPWARNGQFLGVLQMGAAERARFGHHERSVLAQALAARRYYRVAGWQPWTCAR